MEDYKERLVNEQEALKEKFVKLVEFMVFSLWLTIFLLLIIVAEENLFKELYKYQTNMIQMRGIGSRSL